MLMTIIALFTCVAGYSDPQIPDTQVGDWPFYRGDPGLQGVAQGSLPDNPEVLWIAYTEAAIASSPVISNGRAFVGSDDQSIYAFSLKDGSKLWSYKTDDIVEAPPSVYGDTVYVGSNDGFLYAIDVENGALRWKFESMAKIAGAVNSFTDEDGLKLVFGSYDNNLYCLDPKTGDQVWSYETEDRLNGTPAIGKNSVLIGGCDTYLHQVSLKGEAMAKIELGDACHIAGSVAIKNERVYFGHYGQEFLSYDLKEQKTIWSYLSQRDFFAAPAIGKDRVVFGGRDKILRCLSLDDGKELWTYQSRRQIDGSAVICGEKIVFGTGEGRLYMLSLDSGEEQWSYEVGRSLFSSPAVAQGCIFIGAPDGGLYCFGKKGGEE